MAPKNKAAWNANDIPSQLGRLAVITGANSGIGFEAALELARKGAHIVLPARSLDKAEQAAQRIAEQVEAAQVTPAVMDLASQKSVHAFVASFASRFPGATLDLLINNAGVMALPTRELTEDGFERQFATNFLGPFALTALLYPHLKQQHGSRIVVVSSSASKWGKLDFENLQSERKYRPMSQAYGQSKLADSIFAVELQRRLTAAHSPVIATAAHPGYAVTNLQTSGPGKGMSMLKLLSLVLKAIASQDAHHGALPTLFAATSPKAESGGYYGPDGPFELTGSPTPVPIANTALDPASGTRLWHEAERLTQLPFPVYGLERV